MGQIPYIFCLLYNGVNTRVRLSPGYCDALCEGSGASEILQRWLQLAEAPVGIPFLSAVEKKKRERR